MGAHQGRVMNNRRTLVVTLGSALFTPWALFAQTKKPPIVIAWLGAGRADTGARSLTAFKEGIAALGWKEGEQFVIDGRWAEGRIETLQSLAERLVAKRPTIIVTTGASASRAAANASQNIPIVQANGGSLVDAGLAKSLARPGGMVTGLTNLVGELSTKYLELLLAAAPKLKRVGFLLDRANIFYALYMKSARSAVGTAAFIALDRPGPLPDTQEAVRRTRTALVCQRGFAASTIDPDRDGDISGDIISLRCSRGCQSTEPRILGS